jgi:hypothetical protein
VEKMLSFERIEVRLELEELVARLPRNPDIGEVDDDDPDDTVAARLENDAAGREDDEVEVELVLDMADDNGSFNVSASSL